MFFSAGFTPFTALVSGSGMQRARALALAAIRSSYFWMSMSDHRHSWADAPWLFNILPVPTEKPCGRSVCEVRLESWNGCYEGRKVLSRAVASLDFAVCANPFRELRKIVPFCQWADGGIRLVHRQCPFGR